MIPRVLGPLVLAAASISGGFCLADVPSERVDRTVPLTHPLLCSKGSGEQWIRHQSRGYDSGKVCVDTDLSKRRRYTHPVLGPDDRDRSDRRRDRRKENR